MVKSIKLNLRQQRDLLILTVLSSITVMALFNLFWSPVIFMVCTSYIILNKGKQLSKYELLGWSAFVFPFLLYCMISRLFSIGPGLFVIAFYEFAVILVYMAFWRHSR